MTVTLTKNLLQAAAIQAPCQMAPSATRLCCISKQNQNKHRQSLHLLQIKPVTEPAKQVSKPHTPQTAHQVRSSCACAPAASTATVHVTLRAESTSTEHQPCKSGLRTKSHMASAAATESK